MDTDDPLREEAAAFDRQIEERIANGHIPDLRRAPPCNWFYNNPWRHPAYVQLDFGEQFEIITQAIDRHTASKTVRVRVLEVGCGPGYLSLELARHGYDVTGLDLSERAIHHARRVAEEDPWKAERGPLHYVCGDIARLQVSEQPFDAIVFLGALHHFPDQHAVMRKAETLLSSEGLVVAHEPTRDRATLGNALFMQLVRVLLSAGRGYYQPLQIPENVQVHLKQAERLFHEQRYETEDGDKVQSVNDNEAGHREMIAALDGHLERVLCQDRYAFFHEVIGGLRFDEQTNADLARFLRDADALLCKHGVLQATEFFYVGRKRTPTATARSA
jgi:SAM-dependent methyltransferase